MIALGVVAFALCGCADQGITRESLVGADEPKETSGNISILQLRYMSEVANTEQRYWLNFSMLPQSKVSFEICEEKWEDTAQRASCTPVERGVSTIGKKKWDELRDFMLIARPVTMSKEFPFISPKGCGFIFDQPSVLSIHFGQPNGIGGLFIIQPNQDCEGVKVARNYVDALLAQLPDQSLVKRYPIAWD